MIVETTHKKRDSRFIIVFLLVVILALTSVIGYFVVSDKGISDIVKIFKNDEEFTILLDEFILNLRSENLAKNYLRINIALMYTEEKHGKVINLNISKIRDIIIKDLGEKNAMEMLDGDNTLKIKKEIIDHINDALGEVIVKDVYFTNLVIQ